MRVLSVFDGISCAKVALDRLGLPITEYLSSEIDPHAIKISQANHPDITRLGDVREISMSHLKGPIDLMIGGSPCQDLSIAKKNRKGLAGDRSGLFWEFVRIKNHIRPRWFILENVASMPSADRDTISQALGVNPVMIDASLVSAQSRKRLFWTNIPFTMPEDRGILLKDILQPDDEVHPSFTVKGEFTPTLGKTTKLGHIGATDGQANRVYDPDGKSVTLSANGGGSGAKTGLYAIGRDIGRRLTPDGTRADNDTSLPYERRVELRTDDKSGTLTSVQKDNVVVRIPEATKQGYALARPGDSVDLSFPNSTTRRGRVGQKAKTLMTSSTIGVLTEECQIRKLTPIECERLQGLPDGYTDHVAKTHRYKALGNAFNVDVIASILRGIQSTPSVSCP